jgi:hypothetical protein
MKQENHKEWNTKMDDQYVGHAGESTVEQVMQERA